MAILQYIDEKWPSPNLFPKDPKEKALCIQLCETVNSGIQPIQNLKVMSEVVKRYNQEDSEKAKWGHFWIDEGFIALEKLLEKTAGDYSLGNQITAADLFLVPQVYNADRFNVDMDKFPKIKKVNANCVKLDFFNKAEPSNQIDSPEP